MPDTPPLAVYLVVVGVVWCGTCGSSHALKEGHVPELLEEEAAGEEPYFC